MSSITEYLEATAQQVSEGLIRIYAGTDERDERGLIFPQTRGGSIRISEQESKILFAHQFVIDKQFSFSVETPTSQTYRQKGATDMSARIDLTLVAPDAQRLAHIELKAHHNCSVENIRKDLEKLIREDTIGLWFHTLERGDGGRLELLLSTFRNAFEQLANHVPGAKQSLLICFCLLDAGLLHSTWLEFTGDRERNLMAVQTTFGAQSISSGKWQTCGFEHARRVRRTGSPRTLHSPSELSNGKGAREGFFVFAPSVASDTFVHLSVRGGSYRIRNFHRSGPSSPPPAVTVQGYPSFDALRSSGVILKWIPVTLEDSSHNVMTEFGYWYGRIQRVNSQELPEKQ